MALAVQVADLCMDFCLSNRGMDIETRPEIVDMFGAGLNSLQYKKQGHDQV